MTVTTVPVDLGDRSYDIVIGPDLTAQAGRFIAPVLGGRRAIVLTDTNVGPLYLDGVLASLRDAGISADEITVPAGEATKSTAQLGMVLDRLFDLGIERGSALVALGGGVVGDLTGFAAAIALRGIDFIQIPTSLLAQVDSSVGGKTGINVPAGKNLVGAFHQPRLVLADIGALDTLTPREMRAGYAEVVKYGAIDDPAFFAWLVANGSAVLEGDAAARSEAVAVSCRAKARIVAADEREAGQRALLNFGHTFGHALESATGYGDRLLHGEAVAIGMVMAFDLSVRLGLCPPTEARRFQDHLDGLGLPTRLSDIDGPDWGADDLIARMATDKKVKNGRLTFILTRGIGQAFITRDVALDDLRATMVEAVAA